MKIAFDAFLMTLGAAVLLFMAAYTSIFTMGLWERVALWWAGL